MVKTKDYKIVTIGSHSALQILKGAHDEGFSTIAVCIKGREKPYRLFKVADEIITINNYAELIGIQDMLIKKKAIFIPHASLIAYLGTDKLEKLKIPYYGNKNILRFESDRKIERTWLKQAGLKLPKIFKSPKEIDRSVIVKFHGARGGKGYFLAKNERDFNKKIKLHPKEQDYVIQEYLLGVHMYIHYFYSSLTNELEVMGFDKRYESNVDSLGRVSARDQFALPAQKVDPSYVIVGNIPVVVRESFLPRIIDMGEGVVKVSKKMTPGGLWGPFCLETIMTPEEEIYTFEISARIVAGTNPYIEGSPYTWLKYTEPMSTGRRIAREIKTAIKQNKLNKVLG
ncbi:formate--phosphoribosylaminoimidazolecarboxamide ligase [Candidatus Woesearchaeota archaeon]|nr:formate--phosphoribosylaminoimidazolecarboxamide ligase [Candidatus Woesearchaeota archaeon]